MKGDVGRLLCAHTMDAVVKGDVRRLLLYTLLLSQIGPIWAAILNHLTALFVSLTLVMLKPYIDGLICKFNS